MKKEKTSLKDIAKKLDLSPTTISFVLNGKGEEKKISKGVIEKVKKHVKSVNYRPNLIAQSLRTGKTNILVFMVEDISNPFFAQVARLIEEIAYENGYKILFCSNENDERKSSDLIAMFNDGQVDGFIIIPSPGIESQIISLQEKGMPVVLFDRYFPEVNSHHVVVDNFKAAKNATQHLIENGYKKIAFITTDAIQVQMEDRLRGYREAIEAANQTELTLRVPFRESTTEAGKIKIIRFLETNSSVDAVFFSTNYLTQIGLEVIVEYKANLLHQMGLITFDDNELFKLFTPPITAIAQPLQKIAEELMNIMLTVLEKPSAKLMQKVLPTELIIRKSSLSKANGL